jgi:hypothetical protein
MQWLTGVPMLHHLGLPMVRYRASGPDLPGFLWCACDPLRSNGLPAYCRAIGPFWQYPRSWWLLSGPYLTSLSPSRFEMACHGSL